MTGKPRVVVAMSGGVDSSLTAALLVHQGYDVIGATMQIWEPDKPDEDPERRGCCSLSAVDDARRVADRIGIPYYVLNFREIFQETVIDYFIREYAAGRTPNPCIACNRYVKFEEFMRRARELGAEFMATGHYARVEQDPVTGRFLLKKGVDSRKDQSYALYHLNQDMLRHFLLPLGNYRKVETRQLAREYGLSVAEKPDSQEICFVPDDDYKSFLEDKAPESLKPGVIRDTHGRVLGRHGGLPLYTVGQRKGLGIAAGKPLYVVELNYDANEVIVGADDDVFAAELIAQDPNFIAFDVLERPLEVSAKIRYGSKEGKAVVSPLPDNRLYVKFADAQRAITPGQSVVFYDGDIVVGGATIDKVIRS